MMRLLFFLIFFSTNIHFAFATELIAVTDVSIRFVNSEKIEKISAGQILKSEINEPLWITSNGRIPMLVVPLKSNMTQLRIDPPPINHSQKVRCDMSSAEDRQVVSKEMSRVVISLFEIQKLIALNKRFEARKMLDKLQASYPQALALDFLGASLDVLDGHRLEAKTRLKRATEAHPDYVDGKNLLKSLSGKADQP